MVTTTTETEAAMTVGVATLGGVAMVGSGVMVVGGALAGRETSGKFV